jgi:hypothetical protein
MSDPARSHQRKKAANYLSERIDHFFKVDQVLRQHNCMLEAELWGDSASVFMRNSGRER